MSNSWKCLSVKEFTSQCNWDNVAPITTAVAVAQLQRSLENWQCLTIEDFFARHNWSGELSATAVDLELQARQIIPVFDLTASSQRFWQCFNWSGEQASPEPAKIEQVLKATESAIAEVREFSLDDLSQLF